MDSKTAVVLHNVRSSHNVGSIFRTADAAGVAHMYLTGYTPYPKDRFGRPQKEIAKTALGAESVIPWEKRQDVIALLKRLKRDRWRIVGVEQDERSVDYRKIKVETPTVFVFGNEVRGLSRTVRNVCDALIEIPMSGTKESLNVSVAAGIVLFSTLR